MLINCTSLVKTGAIEALRADVLLTRPDLIAVCETWFKPVMLDAMFNIDGYALFRRDRVRRTGGGVALYVLRSYHFFN